MLILTKAFDVCEKKTMNKRHMRPTTMSSLSVFSHPLPVGQNINTRIFSQYNLTQTLINEALETFPVILPFSSFTSKL
ncbi:hypothetical protein L1987_00244 [Smallanthus sonchifolius]|uniref:Uncharacterized protein n=1 Tax=Smallanthus sonchifolius TaxID=185202 RepID=A0ACB9K1P3_9ASTR|nr:hypothetical protein L1987_00244 [Smallanthus sonchifolius]